MSAPHEIELQVEHPTYRASAGDVECVLNSSPHTQFFLACTFYAVVRAHEAALAELAAVKAERNEALASRRHTWDWIAGHYGKLEDWARTRLPENWRNEFFSCIANGSWGHQDTGKPYTCVAGFKIVPTNYFRMDDAASQLLSDHMRRAEVAEARVKDLEAELEEEKRC